MNIDVCHSEQSEESHIVENKPHMKSFILQAPFKMTKSIQELLSRPGLSRSKK